MNRIATIALVLLMIAPTASAGLHTVDSVDTRFEEKIVPCRGEWDEEGDNESYTFTYTVTCTIRHAA